MSSSSSNAPAVTKPPLPSHILALMANRKRVLAPDIPPPPIEDNSNAAAAPRPAETKRLPKVKPASSSSSSSSSTEAVQLPEYSGSLLYVSKNYTKTSFCHKDVAYSKVLKDLCNHYANDIESEYFQRKCGEHKQFIHQKILQDYMNPYTNVRGIQINHVLGGGKTASAIGVATAFPKDMEVIVFTPNALIKNFYTELLDYADYCYRKKQHWVKKTKDEVPDLGDTFFKYSDKQLAELSKQDHIWCIEKHKESNFSSLKAEQKEIMTQIRTLLDLKYKVFPYDTFAAHTNNHCLNWMNDVYAKETTENRPHVNPFDNKIIIIDESHEFMSRVQSQQEKKTRITPSQMKFEPDTENGKQKNMKKMFNYFLYCQITKAKNCRVMLLSGSPDINSASEHAHMNMVFGETLTFKFSPIPNIDYETVNKIKKSLNESLPSSVNYSEHTSNSLTLCRAICPILDYRTEAPYIMLTDNEFIAKVQETIKRVIPAYTPNEPEIQSYDVLPYNKKDFDDLLLDETTGLLTEKSKHVIKSRIYGGTSYFDVPMKHLMPITKTKTGEGSNMFYGRVNRFKDILEELVPMSDFQFTNYVSVRKHEIEKEIEQQKKKQRKNFTQPQNGTPVMPPPKQDFSTYRIESRAVCNYVNDLASLDKDLAYDMILNDKRAKAPYEYNVNDFEHFVDPYTTNNTIQTEQEAIRLMMEMPVVDEDIEKSKADDEKDLGPFNDQGQVVNEGDSEDADEIGAAEDEQQQIVEDGPQMNVGADADGQMNVEDGAQQKEEENGEPMNVEDDQQRNEEKDEQLNVDMSNSDSDTEVEVEVEDGDSDDNDSIGFSPDGSPDAKRPRTNDDTMDSVAGGSPDNKRPRTNDNTYMPDSDGDNNSDVDEVEEPPNISAEREAARRADKEARKKAAKLAADAQDTTGFSHFFGPEVLRSYSPKMARIIHKILQVDKYIGNHLFYSYFRSYEGVNFFAHALREIGYKPFRIHKVKQQEEDIWEMTEATRLHLMSGGKTYIDYGGVKGSNPDAVKEEKETLRLVFNSDWDVSGDKSRSTLFRQCQEVVQAKINLEGCEKIKNALGHIVKVFIITDSGTRGITLKCIRYLHMLDCFWHMVKTLQTKGRAIRLCSHSRLPKELQNVEVFLYMSTFTQEQQDTLDDREYIDFFNRSSDSVPIPNSNKRIKITSDEYMYTVALRKDQQTEEILKCSRESAFDAQLFNKPEYKNDAIEAYTTFKYSNKSLIPYTTKPNIVADLAHIEIPATQHEGNSGPVTKRKRKS